MGFISEFTKTLTSDLMIYWVLALVGSFVFVIQVILFLFGFAGGHTDTDIDHDGEVSFGEHADMGFDAFKLFSLRSIIAFITFFGWGGVIWGENGLSGFFAACACGFVTMFLTALMFFFLLKLQQSGNVNPQDFIGCLGTVYLGVPSGRTECGKVTVTIQGSTRQVKAVADEEIPTGTAVEVVSLVGPQRYLVRKT